MGIRYPQKTSLNSFVMFYIERLFENYLGQRDNQDRVDIPLHCSNYNQLVYLGLRQQLDPNAAYMIPFAVGYPFANLFSPEHLDALNRIGTWVTCRIIFKRYA